LTGVERIDLGAPQGQHADDLVLQNHRRRQQRAIACQALQVAASVLGVVQHVRNLNGPHLFGGATDCGRSVPGKRLVLEQPAKVLGDLAGVAGQPERISFGDVQRCGLRTAQLRGALDDGVENGLWVGVGTPEGCENFTARH
jgi:hypothetical protein